MRIRKTLLPALALLFGATALSFAQTRLPYRPPYSATGYYYPGSSAAKPFTHESSFTALDEMMRRTPAEERQIEYDAYLASERRRKADEERALRAQREPQPHADPDAPDQSELLRNSKDHEFILRNFRTMYIDASEAKYFGSDLIKAALGRNKDFQKLNIHIVDDPRVADAVLKITYSFAWDFPFELRHQNTTLVLLSGKGEGPLYGPLGATDAARQFVNAAKPWRETKIKTTAGKQ
jgi:hypothetical protein